MLYVFDGSCGGAELGCDDDSGGSLQSSVTVLASAGQHLIVVVDGFSDHAGTYVVNVSRGSP